MKFLTTLANKYNSDKGSEHGSKHEFTEIYDEYLNSIRDSAKNILEIGINDGASLKMWYDYFSQANIYAVDIDNKSQYDNERVICNIVDQSNKEYLENFSNNINIEFDFIIDDGSHHMKDQQLTFGYFFPLLKPGGIYVVEDLHTSLCENNEMIYGRPIEIWENNLNTTLYYFNNFPGDSVYLTQEQNDYIKNNVEDVKVFERHNIHVPDNHKNKSITSIILKK